MPTDGDNKPLGFSHISSLFPVICKHLRTSGKPHAQAQAGLRRRPGGQALVSLQQTRPGQLPDLLLSPALLQRTVRSGLVLGFRLFSVLFIPTVFWFVFYFPSSSASEIIYFKILEGWIFKTGTKFSDKGFLALWQSLPVCACHCDYMIG